MFYAVIFGYHIDRVAIAGFFRVIARSDNICFYFKFFIASEIVVGAYHSEQREWATSQYAAKYYEADGKPVFFP